MDKTNAADVQDTSLITPVIPSAYTPNRNKIIFTICGLILLLGTIAVIYFVTKKESSQVEQSNAVNTNTTSQTVTSVPLVVEPDSESTIETPEKISTQDGLQYFLYGAPSGQNNANPRKIIISLHGHDSSAEDDYNAWLPHIKDGTYALASLNWWDGDGENVEDYVLPQKVVEYSRYLLNQLGYKSSDIVILEGFSRGSAVTYAIIANDKLTPNPIFDGVISASGSYQSNFPLNPSQLIDPSTTNFYNGIPWILVCGEKDPNVESSGCEVMKASQSFLEAHGAYILSFMQDPDGDHGAFHAGNKNYPELALNLFDGTLL